MWGEPGAFYALRFCQVFCDIVGISLRVGRGGYVSRNVQVVDDVFVIVMVAEWETFARCGRLHKPPTDCWDVKQQLENYRMPAKFADLVGVKANLQILESARVWDYVV